jgi:hypothetical protein
MSLANSLARNYDRGYFSIPKYSTGECYVEKPANTRTSNWLALWLEFLTLHQEDMSLNPECEPTRRAN